MQTTRYQLGTSWQLLGRGPGLVQIYTQGIVLLYIGSSPPDPEANGHHMIGHDEGALSYGGTANLYGRTLDGPVSITVSATTIP